MPASYHCDTCDESAATLAGWYLISIAFLRDDPNQPTPPGGRTLDTTLPDLMFHTVACRDAWCEKVGIPSPPAPPA